MTMRIEGLAEGEIRAILEEMRSPLDAEPGIVYERIWRPGDLVTWCNRCSTHAPTDFPADQTRLTRRCAGAGEPPIAARGIVGKAVCGPPRPGEWKRRER